MLRNVVDVECKLGADVLVWAFGIVHVWSVLLFQVGKFLADGNIDRLGMPNGVAVVMRQRANRKCDIIRVLRVPEKRSDKIAGSDVMQQVREQRLSERIIAEVLDDATAVRVGARLLKLNRREVGKSLQQEWLDGIRPGEVDDLLMRED